VRPPRPLGQALPALTGTRAGAGESSGAPVRPPRPLGQAHSALTGTRAGTAGGGDKIIFCDCLFD